MTTLTVQLPDSLKRRFEQFAICVFAIGITMFSLLIMGCSSSGPAPRPSHRHEVMAATDDLIFIVDKAISPSPVFDEPAYVDDALRAVVAADSRCADDAATAVAIINLPIIGAGIKDSLLVLGNSEPSPTARSNAIEWLRLHRKHLLAIKELMLEE